MAKYTNSIAPEVMAVLQRSTVDATTVVLPPGQLERSLYEAVNKVLTACGGKWDRRAKAHVFASDPRPALGLALETAVVTDVRKQRQQFFTPQDVAERVIRAADVQAGDRVLEPSAGGGALARAARSAGGIVTCVEVDEALATALAHECLYEQVVHGDFLAMTPDPSFDVVVMNPPFATGADVKHVTHALDFLKPNGRLVAIMSGSFPTKTARAAAGLRQRLYDMGALIHQLPAGAFTEAGTQVTTVMVVLNKQESEQQ